MKPPNLSTDCAATPQHVIEEVSEGRWRIRGTSSLRRSCVSAADGAYQLTSQRDSETGEIRIQVEGPASLVILSFSGPDLLPWTVEIIEP